MSTKARKKVVRSDINKATGLPRGFTMSKDVRKILFGRILCAKFSDRFEKLFAEEKKLMFDITEFIFPKKAQDLYRQMIEAMPTGKAVFGPANHYTIYGGSSRNSKDSANIGNMMPFEVSKALHSWSEGHKLMWKLKHSPEYYEEKPQIPFPLSCHRAIEGGGAESALPEALLKRVQAYDKKAIAFRTDFYAFGTLVEDAMRPITSVKQLRELSPKMYKVLQEVALEMKPPCSDVSIADGAAGVEAAF